MKKEKTQKYALLMVGKKRVWMTEEELISAIRISFRDEKQNGFQFSFVIQEMTDEALKHEKRYDIIEESFFIHPHKFQV